MDTQPIDEVEVETGNSPCLDPVPADTAERDVQSPGQPKESAKLDATTMPKLSTEEDNEISADASGDKKEAAGTQQSQKEPPQLEPEVETKEDTSTVPSSENPAGASVEPMEEVVKTDLETPQETKEAAETPDGEKDELEEGETPAKKPKVADQEETTTDPKKVFCEE